MKIKINYDRLGKEFCCMWLSFYTRFIGFHDNVDVRETSERPAPTIAYKEMTLIDFYQMPRSPPKFFHAAPPFHKWILSFLFDPFKIMFDILSQKKKNNIMPEMPLINRSCRSSVLTVIKRQCQIPHITNMTNWSWLSHWGKNGSSISISWQSVQRWSCTSLLLFQIPLLSQFPTTILLQCGD